MLERQPALLSGAVEGKRPLQVLAAFDQLAHRHERVADGAVRHQAQQRVLLFLGEAEQLLGGPERRVQLGAHQVKHVLPIEHVD